MNHKFNTLVILGVEPGRWREYDPEYLEELANFIDDHHNDITQILYATAQGITLGEAVQYRYTTSAQGEKLFRYTHEKVEVANGGYIKGLAKMVSPGNYTDGFKYLKEMIGYHRIKTQPVTWAATGENGWVADLKPFTGRLWLAGGPNIELLQTLYEFQAHKILITKMQGLLY